MGHILIFSPLPIGSQCLLFRPYTRHRVAERQNFRICLEKPQTRTLSGQKLIQNMCFKIMSPSANG